MILAIHDKGRGFKGLLSYILGPGKANPEILGGTMTSTTIDGLCREAGRYRKKRNTLKKAVFHASLRKADGDNVSQEQMTNMAMEIMEDLGFGKAPFVVCGHDDHIHIAAIRINAQGATVSDSMDYERGATSLQRLEKEYGLIPIAQTPIGSAKMVKRGAPNWQHQRAQRTGEALGLTRLQDIIDKVIDGNVLLSAESFISLLFHEGVETRMYYRKGKLSGLGYEFEGIKYKASQLGQDYTVNGLRGRGFADHMSTEQVAARYGSDRDLVLEQIRLDATGENGSVDLSVVNRKITELHSKGYDPHWRDRSNVQRRYYILYRKNIALENIQEYRIWENKNGKFLINNEKNYHIWDKGDRLILRKVEMTDLKRAVRLMIEIAQDKGWNLRERADLATGSEEFLSEVRRQVEERLAQVEYDKEGILVDPVEVEMFTDIIEAEERATEETEMEEETKWAPK